MTILNEIEKGLRDPNKTKEIIQQIRQKSEGLKINIVHVCGTHEYTISHYGLRSILPKNIRLIAGPGCPVCVCAAKDIDEAIYLAKNGVTLTTFGDMIRVPSTNETLSEVRSKGGKVVVVYSIHDAVEYAKSHPDEDVVFFAAGFETTAPSIAYEVVSNPPSNFSVLTSLKVVPPAMKIMLDIKDINVSGFICPGHVSAIIGSDAYKEFPEKYNIPTVVAGFEPIDVLYAILLIVEQVRNGEAKNINEYFRVVRPEGNIQAKKIMNDAFTIIDTQWRGLGTIKNSGLEISEKYSEYNARKKYDIKIGKSVDIIPGCICHLVIVGLAEPEECPFFGTKCTPQMPYGPCMVSYEGTCRIRYETGEIEL